jgi:hypothetical protein
VLATVFSRIEEVLGQSAGAPSLHIVGSAGKVRQH